MLTLNQVTLIGFLGRDPEVRRLPSGDVAATLSIATRQRVRAPEGGGEYTEWHRVKLYGPLAVTAKAYLRKGRQVYMEGKLKTESWTDPNGTRHSRVVVQGHQLVMLDRKSSTHRFLEQGMVSESMEWLNESAPAPFAPPVGRRERAEELV